MAVFRRQAPIWFWVAGVFFLLWGVIGVYAFYADVTMSAAAKAQLPAYDRNLLASRPGWYIWLYGAAVWSGLIGSAALLLRSPHARWLYVVSLVTVVLMFGYTFAATDLIQVKGFGVAAGFPIVIFLICLAQIWVARTAIQRRWIR